MRREILLVSAFFLGLGSLFTTPALADGGYAVVVSQSTYDQAKWKAVVDALGEKHQAKVILYKEAVTESLASLKEQFPRYACFVTEPTNATRQFVAEVHQLTRRLDDDPYTDTFWGILTGYDAANALAIAKEAKPLVVRKVGSGTDVALDCCEEGLWYDELVKNKMVQKKPGGKMQQLQGPDDTTSALVDLLNEYKADLFVTSGHATERDWQIGFRYRNGQFRCTKGQLYGLDTKGKKHPIDSPNPKVYMPIGNCLMGHIRDRESMALAWMNSAGVRQMLGYTIPTGFGYGGWGCLDYFVEQPGRYTFMEAFLANHHALIHRLNKPDAISFEKRRFMGDRDVVAFYGDPAWEARMAPGKCAYDQTLTVKDGTYTLEIKPNLGEKSFAPVNTNGSQRGGRPFVQFLDHRIKNVQILQGKDFQPLITDNFILFPRPEKCDPSKVYRVVFTAEPITAKQEKPTAKIKNVLFIVSDDLKASVLGCYGDKVCKTPNIDRLASEGMVFDRAYCQGTWCHPSRQSFMFSRYRGKGPVNLGQYFKENGWYSARVGKIYHMRVPGDIIAGTDGNDVPSSWTERFNSAGLEAHTPGDYACLNLNIFTTELEGRQSTRMPHRAYVTVKYKGDGSDQPDFKTADKTIELLQQHKDKPFFLAAGLVRPHYPMVAPNQYFEPYPFAKIQLPRVVANDLDDIPKAGWAGSRNDTTGLDKFPDNQRRMWSGYYATVAFMDAQVGRILDELERLGLRDSTAIVLLSDHGYHLGEHTFWQKSNLHEEVTRVPLIISVPGLKPGRSNSIVELVDLFPTLSDLAGLAIPEDLHGTSLVSVLQDPEATVKEAALSFSNGHSLRTSDWAYMRYKDKMEELYDMNKDPGQFTNLARNPEYAAQLEKMRDALTTRLEDAGL